MDPLDSTATLSRGPRQTRLEKALLAILIVAFVTLSTLYSFTVPIFEPQDEEAHFQFSEHFATKMRLPDFREISDLQSAGYQAHQTPLYYFFQGILLRFSGNSEISFNYRDNPFRSSGTPGFYYHNQPGEKFPYGGKYRVIHLLRFTNVIVGGLTLLVIYKTVQLLLPRANCLTLATTAFVGLIPQFTYICGTLNNDVLAVLFASMTTFFLVKFLLEQHDNRKHVLGMSGSLALAILSKQLNLFLIPVVYLAALFKGDNRRRIGNILMVSVVLTALVGWYYTRNYILFGDLFNAQVQARELSPILVQKKSFGDFYPYFFNTFIQTFIKSFWGSFGYMTIWMSWNIYLFYNVAAGVGLCCFAVGLIDADFRRSLSKQQGLTLTMLFLMFLLLAAQLIFLNFSYSQPQGRWAFAWLSGLAIFWGFGIDRIISLKEKQKNWFSFSLICLFALVNLHVLSTTIKSGFPPVPSTLDVVQNQYQANLGELKENMVVGQSFHCNIEKLDQVAVKFTTFSRYNNCHIIFHLRDTSAPTRDLVAIRLPAIRIRNDAFHIFKFTPLENSKGRDYFFLIESPDGRKDHAVGCYYTFLDSYSGGTAFLDNRPLPGDLAFITGRT